MFHPRPQLTFVWQCNGHQGEVEADDEDSALAALRFMLGDEAEILLETITERTSACGG